MFVFDNPTSVFTEVVENFHRRFMVTNRLLDQKINNLAAALRENAWNPPPLFTMLNKQYQRAAGCRTHFAFSSISLTKGVVRLRVSRATRRWWPAGDSIPKLQVTQMSSANPVSHTEPPCGQVTG